MNNDVYGRAISLDSSTGQDVYTVTDPATYGGELAFTLAFDSGTPESQVYSSIEAMAPPWYTPPVRKPKA